MEHTQIKEEVKVMVINQEPNKLNWIYLIDKEFAENNVETVLSTLTPEDLASTKES